MKLTKKLNELGTYPFHMPGHKRNPAFQIPGAEIDITEITGMDNLHSPDGVLLEIEDKLTAHYESEKSFMLVNGSTVGILAGIFTLCNEGEKIIVARNCHKSVFNACYLRKLRIVYAEPEFDTECGYYTAVTQEEIDRVTAEHPDAKALVITSPTYEGMLSDVKCEMPLLIDAAHGAHLGIAPFPAYPRGDIVVSSLHKTLPALTQTAVANIYHPSFIKDYKKYLDIFETSSPSYVLMNSVDICTDFLSDSERYFKRYYYELTQLHALGLKWLKIKRTDDLGKIVVSTAGASINARDLAKALRDRCGIEIEAALKEHIILMTSVADTPEAFDKLKDALITMDSECDKKSFKAAFVKPPCTKDSIIINDGGESELTDIEHAAGKIANEYVFAYPPDIPLIVPNEVISREMCDYIASLITSGVNVISDSGNLPKVLTKAS